MYKIYLTLNFLVLRAMIWYLPMIVLLFLVFNCTDVSAFLHAYDV
jgi:hypothetical protein